MKRFIVYLLALTCPFLLNSCKKDLNPTPSPGSGISGSEFSAGMRAPSACSFSYFALTVTATGTSQLWKFVNSPGNPALSITPVNGSLSNNIIGSSLPGIGSLLNMTGIAYNPNTGVFLGITGAGSTPSNSLITFSLSDINTVTSTQAITACAGITLDLSDIERNPTNGQYLAINKGTILNNNRVIRINAPAAIITTTCMGTIPVNTQIRGLTFDCTGKAHVIRPFGLNATTFTLMPNLTIMNSYNYPSTVTPGGIGLQEAGLHWDCNCINRYITGSSNAPNPLITDGLPAGLGGPVYNAAFTPIAIPPIVDFAR